MWHSASNLSSILDGKHPFLEVYSYGMQTLLLPATNEDFVHGEVHDVLGRGHDIFCASVISWVFYGKQASFLCC